MKHIILITLILTMSACKTQSKSLDTNKDPQLISKGNLYGAGEEKIDAQNLVITNAKAWEALKTKMDTVNVVTNGFAETEIDFSKYIVIAVFNPVVGSGGHSVHLEIEPTDAQVNVHITNKSPSGMVTSVMTQPYCIVKIEKTKLPINFNNKA